MKAVYSLEPFNINELKSIGTRRKPVGRDFRHVCESLYEFVDVL